MGERIPGEDVRELVEAAAAALAPPRAHPLPWRGARGWGMGERQTVAWCVMTEDATGLDERARFGPDERDAAEDRAARDSAMLGRDVGLWRDLGGDVVERVAVFGDGVEA